MSFLSFYFYRLELPSKKSIGVKAKQTKLVEEVLRPILLQYGWNLDQMVVQVRIFSFCPPSPHLVRVPHRIINPDKHSPRCNDEKKN